MNLGVHLRKELRLLARDPVGLAVALLVPVAVVWLYSLLAIGPVAFPAQYRETSPAALVLCLAVWLSALTLSATSLLKERAVGTLERLSATPFSAPGLVAAKGLTLSAVAVVQALVAAGLGSLLLEKELTSAPFSGVLLPLALLAVAGVAVGMLLSAVLRSATQISSAVTLLTLVSVTLSGFLKPLGDLRALGDVAALLPFTLAYRVLHGALDEVPPEPLAGILILSEAVAALVVSGLLVRRGGAHAR